MMRDIHFTGGILPERAVVSVSGPDAVEFLHNLLTADIEGLQPKRATYGALLTPQGKILFDLFVFRTEDGFLLDCAASQAGDLIKRLTLYKLRAKVTIARVEDLNAGASPTEPAEVNRYVDPRCPALGWRFFTEHAEAPAEGYSAARIALGLADTDADLASGEFFPHEANLDQLGGVSFQKGCYVGQEVVSRMEHRGTARSRILPADLSGPAPPKGTHVRSGDKQVGTLLSSAGKMALVLIRLDRLAEANGPLLTDGVTVTVLKPRWARYEVPNTEEEA